MSAYNQFGIIKDINPQDEQSYKNKVFITMDLDWCSDEVLRFTIDLLEESKICTTLFVTHPTDLLIKLKENKDIELGIHPNFNLLLNGDFTYGKNISEVLDIFKNIVPDSVSVRSHSMTQNSLILDEFEKKNLLFDCNTFIPFSSDIVIKPYNHWTKKLVKVPYFWEDDIHILYQWDWDVERYLNYPGLKVFDFHPIHLFLNTERLNRYENARKDLHNYSSLVKHVNKSKRGVRDFFLDIIHYNQK